MREQLIGGNDRGKTQRFQELSRVEGTRAGKDER